MPEEQEGFLSYGKNRLRFLKVGVGPKVIMAFHGFGQDASAYLPLARLLAEKYTFISLDFPGDSSSLWDSKNFPDKKIMSGFIYQICDEYKVEKISLMGFSMGGRPVLSMTDFLPQKIERVILLAPDGMKRNIWYYLATHNYFGRLIFKNVVKKPLHWQHHLDKLVKRKIVRKRWLQIAHHVLGDEKYRQKLITHWPFTHNFIPNPNKVRRTINRYLIPLDLFMGSKDPVFPPKEGRKFLKKVDKGYLHVLNCGHNILREDALNRIVTEF